MLKAGTRLSVMKDGKPETITVAYLGKQFVIVDHDYQVHYPAFYSQAEDLSLIKIRTQDATYFVQGMFHPPMTELHLMYLPPELRHFHLDDKTGDILVLANTERTEFAQIKFYHDADVNEHKINEKIESHYRYNRLLPVALYRYTKSPFMTQPCVYNRQYTVWWEADRVPLLEDLREKLMRLQVEGYKRVAPRELVDFDDDATYYISRYDRMDSFFPLRTNIYDINDILEANAIATDVRFWRGYEEFRQDFCEGEGCL